MLNAVILVFANKQDMVRIYLNLLTMKYRFLALQFTIVPLHFVCQSSRVCLLGEREIKEGEGGLKLLFKIGLLWT